MTQYWNSLAGRLFKLVFSGYLILAILVTLTQLVIEYSAVQSRIGTDIASLGQSFSGGVSNALWELDQPSMQTMAQGMGQSSIVTGVRITSADGEVLASAGEIPEGASPGAGGIFAPCQSHAERLVRNTPTGVRDLGELSIFSDRSIALNRIKYSFMVILINSIVKTIGLWIIFYVIITKWLSRPITRLTGAVSRIRFASDSTVPIDLEYPHQDEIGGLAESMNKMQERLYTARSELEFANQSLEEKVKERTQRLSEALNFSETILSSSPLPMGVYTVQGRCALANTAYAELFGTTLAALGESDFRMFDRMGMAGLREQCRIALDQHRPQQVEIEALTLSGRPLWVDCRILPTFTNGADHLLIQFVDPSTIP
jgi:PAS domain-containing protein